MCSECADPAWHSPGVTFNLTDGSSTGGPCPAWPRWAQKVEMLRAELRKIASQPAAEPSPLPPGPIAVIKAGLPIEDVIAKLTASKPIIPAPSSARANGTAGKSGPPSNHPASNRPVPDTPA